MKMDIFNLIKSRRSVRKFSKKNVPKDIIERVIESANWAPSACDIQGWRFIIIDEDKIKEAIVNKGAASFIKNAPIGILVLYNNQTENVEYKDYIQSAAAAIQNMNLTSHSLGIGSCWVCHLPPKKQLRNLLKIPYYYDPIAYIALGYFDIKPKPKPRKKELKEIICYNKYQINEDVPPKLNLKLIAKRFLIKIYYRMPLRKYIKPIVDDMFEKRFE